MPSAAPTSTPLDASRSSSSSVSSGPFGQAAAVFDAFDADVQRLLDGSQRMRVHADRDAGAMREIGGRGEFLQRELRLQDVGAGGVHPAAGHDLHDVDPAVDPLVGPRR